MDRPSTSKPRGVCRFYATTQGCRAGDSCKFLHGADSALTPYDRSKTCKFYAQGYCTRGSSCWFRHALPGPVASTSREPSTSEAEAEDTDCSICYEKPVTFGLLVGCSHIFCIKCIRQWRGPKKENGDVVASGATKKCPLCRASSLLIVPSSIFYPEGHPEKKKLTERYKASMARVACKYFQKSPPDRRFCPFGSDCFYQHQNPDGTPYLFALGAEYYLNSHIWSLYPTPAQARLRRGDLPSLNFMLDNPPFTLPYDDDEAFDNPLDDISATIAAIRASLPPGTDVVNGWADAARNGVADASQAARHFNAAHMQQLTTRLLAGLSALQGQIHDPPAVNPTAGGAAPPPWQDTSDNSWGDDDGPPPLEDISDSSDEDEFDEDDSEDEEPQASSLASTLSASARPFDFNFSAPNPRAPDAPSTPLATLAPLALRAAPSSVGLFESTDNGIGHDADASAGTSTAAAARFSTVVRGRERLVIDIDSDGESGEEANGEAVDAAEEADGDDMPELQSESDDGSDTGSEAAGNVPDRAVSPPVTIETPAGDDGPVVLQHPTPVASDARVALASIHVTAAVQEDPAGEFGPEDGAEAREGGLLQLQNTNPPFKTDGRGKVVWSSPSVTPDPDDGPGEGREGRKRRHTRT